MELAHGTASPLLKKRQTSTTDKRLINNLDLLSVPLKLISAGHIVVINQLVEAGANIDAAADEGKMQPLHVAAAMGHVEAVSALISAGAVVDARDRRLRTPLALAASYG